MSNGKMQDKRVLVTGAGTGIGSGIAYEFATEGAAVALHYNRSGESARALVDKIRTGGGRAEGFKADLSSVGSARDLAREALIFLGGVDVLVNNAGITMNRPFEKVTQPQYDKLYDVNVRAMFFLAQAMVPHMIENGSGVVINLSSIHAHSSMAEHSVYAGTKAAIVGFTRSLSVELAPKGIRVNCIAPGGVITDNQLEAAGPLLEALGPKLPAGFVGEPRDIGRLAVFLATDDARFIIGQTLFADGGHTALMPLSPDPREPQTAQYGRGYVPDL